MQVIIVNNVSCFFRVPYGTLTTCFCRVLTAWGLNPRKAMDNPLFLNITDMFDDPNKLIVGSSGRPPHLASAKYVDVQMRDGLSGAFAAVDYKSVACVFKTACVKRVTYGVH